MTNALIFGITSIISKFFYVISCTNFIANNLNIVILNDSPNIDRIPISDTNDTTVTNNTIKTSDDCIFIGQRVTNAIISKIFCSPKHDLRYIKKILAKLIYHTPMDSGFHVLII